MASSNQVADFIHSVVFIMHRSMEQLTRIGWKDGMILPDDGEFYPTVSKVGTDDKAFVSVTLTNRKGSCYRVYNTEKEFIEYTKRPPLLYYPMSIRQFCDRRGLEKWNTMIL